MPELLAIDYAKLSRELLAQVGVATKAVSSTPTGTYGHGNGGLFSAPGLSRQVFSAMVLPNLGLQSILPVRGARETNPLYGIMTGVTASTGTEPVGVCDDPMLSGLMKLCEHSFVFGRQSRGTRVFDLDRIGQLTNRGEFTDLQFLGGPWVDGATPTVPTFSGTDGSAALNVEVGKVMFELAVAWGRDFARELYTGNPTNNTSGGGRKYFYGLDLLINTGYRDAETSVACPAADSIVRSFGGANINTAGAQIVQEITYIYRNLRYIAQRTGLDPVTWAVCMPWSLFYELTAVWPCAYLTARCALPAGSTQFVDAGDQIAMRDQMRGDITSRTGQYLMIDGQRVEVVLDDAIVETEGFAGGTFQSTIYFVPLRVLGKTPSTFIEYYNYDTPGGSMDAARILASGDTYYTTDGGRFFWHKKPPTNFCVQIIAKTEPRVLLLTPYLAARLTNIRYTPLIHERSPFSDSAYFVNGGKTDRGGYGPSYYTPTP
jgi:hypothetical protein